MVEQLRDIECIDPVRIEKSKGKAVCSARAQTYWRKKGCQGCPQTSVDFNTFQGREPKDIVVKPIRYKRII